MFGVQGTQNLQSWRRSLGGDLNPQLVSESWARVRAYLPAMERARAAKLACGPMFCNQLSLGRRFLDSDLRRAPAHACKSRTGLGFRRQKRRGNGQVP